MDIATTRKNLMNLVSEINSKTNKNIVFHQQSVMTKHMAIKGGDDGTIWIVPTSKGFDIGLRGVSLERNMYSYMRQLTNKNHDKYGYRRDQRMPKWEVIDFNIVIEAAYHYAGVKH